ncbi:MAG TPA: ribonuclease P protein component [Petrotogaceae bacterium]|nr:ribonuclease P protein component [Petrotogaceae bacterium]
MKKMSFRQRERLRLKKDFDSLFDTGGRVESESFVIVYKANCIGYCRLGFSIRKKFGKAHLRNRLRRCLKEIYRTNKPLFPQSTDIIFIPRKGLSKRFSQVTYHELENLILDMIEALR